MTSPNQKTLQVPCQYCGSVDHRLNTCLLQQPRKNKEKDSKSYNKSNPLWVIRK